MLPLFSDELELQGVKRDNGLPRMGEMGRKLGEEDGGAWRLGDGWRWLAAILEELESIGVSTEMRGKWEEMEEGSEREVKKKEEINPLVV